jgi:hypothetical protein
VVGGAWNDPPYMANNREPRSPLDRTATNGFRCVRGTSPITESLVGSLPNGGLAAARRRIEKSLSSTKGVLVRLK